MLFFQLINARHERASTVLTSNKGFEEWGSVLGDEVMAAALIDRLLHHCHIVNIRGNSYRMREHRNLMRSASEQPRQGSRAVMGLGLDSARSRSLRPTQDARAKPSGKASHPDRRLPESGTFSVDTDKGVRRDLSMVRYDARVRVCQMMFPVNTGFFRPQQQPVWTEKWRWRLRVDRIGVDPRAGVDRAGMSKVILAGRSAVNQVRGNCCGGGKYPSRGRAC